MRVSPLLSKKVEQGNPSVADNKRTTHITAIIAVDLLISLFILPPFCFSHRLTQTAHRQKRPVKYIKRNRGTIGLAPAWDLGK
jgi:hypothetical protein